MGRMTLVHALCFHGIGAPGPAVAAAERPYWVTERAFRDILDAVAETPNVEISFDDGNASDVEIALDALLDRGLSATFFVVAGRLGQPGYLDVDGVGELARAEMTVGTHGMDHRSWRRLTDGARQRELVDARAILADVVGGPVSEAAVPMGAYDRRLLRDLRRLGYTAVHTSDRRLARSGAWLRPRFSVRAGDTADSVRRTALAVPSVPRRALQGAKSVVKSFR
jgi:peptidoglycan/xylan/chitin deacetylase (PgdA/CDA1 family)